MSSEYQSGQQSPSGGPLGEVSQRAVHRQLAQEIVSALEPLGIFSSLELRLCLNRPLRTVRDVRRIVTGLRWLEGTAKELHLSERRNLSLVLMQESTSDVENLAVREVLRELIESRIECPNPSLLEAWFNLSTDFDSCDLDLLFDVASSFRLDTSVRGLQIERSVSPQLSLFELRRGPTFGLEALVGISERSRYFAEGLIEHAAVREGRWARGVELALARLGVEGAEAAVDLLDNGMAVRWSLGYRSVSGSSYFARSALK